MTASALFFTASQAARRLGVSPKALRVYEEHGLVAPVRTAAGWRAYGPEAMQRAADIVALRSLGLSLTHIARVLEDRTDGLEEALSEHQTRLEADARRISGQIDKVRTMRKRLAGGEVPSELGVTRLLAPAAEPVIAFDLPWPWGGERFELHALGPLTYIVGPLFSGKTRLARRLADTLPGARFLGLDRLDDGGLDQDRMAVEHAIPNHPDKLLAWLIEDGASPSNALLELLSELRDETSEILVVDMIEQGLDARTQQALMSWLRQRGPGSKKLLMTTRSDTILDLDALGADETVLLCPANHAPPTRVAPYPGAPGYEAVATCLAPPEVRARTEGVIAIRPPAA